ncbi:adenine deaminase [candidate division WOR-3 bacterium]|nr:adenine deaminase [candidate division WOR-3 bacterium]
MKDSDTCHTSVTLSSRRRVLRTALGRERADLALENGRFLNVFTGKLERRNIGIAEGLIACIDDKVDGKKKIDVDGMLLVPGFIDAHIHLETAHLWLPEISRLMLEHGVTTVVADPHEMANIRGLEGVKTMIDASRQVMLDVWFKTPSCVPASGFEEAGARFDTEEINELLRQPEVIGLAEMMNYPGVLAQDPQVWEKLGLSANVDGHAPGLTGKDLQAYIAVGIRNDHETTSADEAREKIARGMRIFIREGSAARNLETLLPALDDATWHRACFCTDDLSASDLLERGSIDFSVRQAVKKGLPTEQALTMASWNTAQAHGLRNVGAIAPGYAADILAIDPQTLEVRKVIKRGKLVVEDGQCILEQETPDVPSRLLNTVHLPSMSADDLRIPCYQKHRAIGLIDGQILTSAETVEPPCVSGLIQSDPRTDILKAAVIERHGKSGNIGLGLVKGLGIKEGAVATTVAHDAHNLVVVGTSDQDMLYAVNRLADTGGGQILIRDGKVIARLDLPIAGLMTAAPASQVAKSIHDLRIRTRELGSALSDPFATLSFLALSVLPKLRLTTQGVLDVEQWKILNIGDT